MPAALDVDRDQVKMLVMSVGVREAARQMGLNENTVLYWSQQGQWMADAKPRPALYSPPPTVARKRPINSISPANALAKVMAEDSEAVRVNALRYARNTTAYAAQVAEECPEQALASAADVKAVLQSAAIAGDWAQPAPPNAMFGLFTISHVTEMAQPEPLTHNLPDYCDPAVSTNPDDY